MGLPTADPRPSQTIPSPVLAVRALRALPKAVILLLLGSLAYAGHHTGWKIPRFSSLGLPPMENPAEKWCDEHGVPEAICVECRPELLPEGKSFGWCKKHGVPECPHCHPELAQLKQIPTVTPADLDHAQQALDFAERPSNGRKCDLHERHIQFANQEALDKSGIEVAPAWRAAIDESVAANGEIAYDETRIAHLASRVKGAVWRTDRQSGDRVHKGDVLALIDSNEVGRAKSEFLHALAQVNLKRKLLETMRPAFDRGAVPETKFRESEAALHESEIRLNTAEQTLVNLGLPIRAADLQNLSLDELSRYVQFLGIPEMLVRDLDHRTTTGNLFPLVAPLEGVIVERHMVPGEVVDTAQVLFVVADLNRMWLTLDVRGEDVRHVHSGQSAQFKPDGFDVEVAGQVVWVSTSVDERTRTVRVRAELDNSDGQLRAGTFGSGRIILREEPEAIVVPNAAVQWEGDCHVVFVRDRKFLEPDALKLFHVRKVRLGAKDDQNTEVIAGLLPGEIVATTGSAVLRAQLLKNNLGEGCGCHKH